MILVRSFGLLIFSLGVVLSVPGHTAAIMRSAAQQIKITATVLPAHTVIVDEEDQIKMVVSNTNIRDISPTIYLNQVLPENARPITPKLSKSISTILEDKTIKPGVLYDRSDFTDRTLLRQEKSINYLFGSKIFNPRY